MKFDSPAGTSAIDQGRVVGKPVPRIDGPLKTTGTAPYAYERHDVAPDAAYGYVLGSAIAKGRIRSMALDAAMAAPGVLAVVTRDDAPADPKSGFNTARLIAGPDVEHYDQAVAMVVAETFEQARAAAQLIRIDYARADGRFDLAAEKGSAAKPPSSGFGGVADTAVGDFAGAFAAAPVTVDTTCTTPDQSHAMMEPHATTAVWDDGGVRVWTSNQMVAWNHGALAKMLALPKDKVRLISPYVGGGFGAKLFPRADLLLAALGARKAGRPVKVALQRPLIMNNTTHRPATIQRVRIGADRDGRITAIGHEGWSGDLPGGGPETAVNQTRIFYAGANRMTRTRLAVLDLPEGNAMRAPGEAPGLMALEIAMDELAEKLGIDPVELRIINDTQVDPEQPERRFSERHFVECLRTGAERFGWSERRARPGQRREGDWLIGMGVAGGFRNNLLGKSAARVTLETSGRLTVHTDMTDIGTGSYTIIAQTAAETMGLPVDRIDVRLGDSADPVSAGSGGQWGANNSTAGVYAACMALREKIATALGINSADARFEDGRILTGNRRIPLGDAARSGAISAEDAIEYGDIDERFALATFAAHFCEVAVNAITGETRIKRMLAVCDAGRILNPMSARSQVIGAMTMGIGAALMEDAVVDKRFGFFVNHDLAGYEVPVHADVPHLEVVFLDHPDACSSPMKAKGVGELGLCGAAAAVANAIYNATGARVREYPITLDKLLDALPANA